jgi:hypothetical protein
MWRDRPGGAKSNSTPRIIFRRRTCNLRSPRQAVEGLRNCEAALTRRETTPNGYHGSCDAYGLPHAQPPAARTRPLWDLGCCSSVGKRRKGAAPMYDVIECFSSPSPRKLMRLIVGQTPTAGEACVRADELWKESTALHEASTFVVVDRTTAREVYRIPEPISQTETV